jgi:ComF family protein
MSAAPSRLFGRPGLLDIAQACVLCDTDDRAAVCSACAKSLARPDVAASCRVCCVPGSSNAVCGQCLAHAPYFDATVAAFHYQFPLDRLVQSFKFRADLKLANFFAAYLAAAVSASYTPGEGRARPDFLVALPLARQRLTERGFNQSALLADGVASRLGFTVAHDAMLRVRDTPPQSGLSRDARIKNIRGAFDCGVDLAGRHIAIVDDVMTTGATLSEAAKVLKKAGAATVEAWVLSRATLGNAHA